MAGLACGVWGHARKISPESTRRCRGLDHVVKSKPKICVYNIRDSVLLQFNSWVTDFVVMWRSLEGHFMTFLVCTPLHKRYWSWAKVSGYTSWSLLAFVDISLARTKGERSKHQPHYIFTYFLHRRSFSRLHIWDLFFRIPRSLPIDFWKYATRKFPRGLPKTNLASATISRFSKDLYLIGKVWRSCFIWQGW